MVGGGRGVVGGVVGGVGEAGGKLPVHTSQV